MSCCDKPKIFEKKNGKVLHEFNCSSCSGYITVKLDEDLNGAHCIVCPSCSHEHYRVIKDGVITEDRAPSSAKSYAIRICPTKAAYSKTSWESKLANRKSNVKPEGKHFLDDAWKKMTGSQKQHPPQTEEVVEVKQKSKCTPKATCISCFTELIDAPGIGPYCPNKKCLQVDDQKTIVKVDSLKEHEMRLAEMSKKEDMIPCPHGLKSDEEIAWYKEKKEERIKAQDFPMAALYRDAERMARENQKHKDQPKEIKVDADEVNIFDELITFCKDRKELKIKTEEYHYAAKWLNIEKKLKFMKEALSK